MQEDYVEVNQVPTHVLTWGHSIRDKFDGDKKEMVLVITGNPGLVGFYSSFGTTLFHELDKKIPVWVIGHAGHDEPKKELQMVTPPLKGNEDLYNLQGQVRHKTDFINKFIPNDVKVHLVSHSIGAKISLELLKDNDISELIRQCYFLFPTIENMVETSNGFYFHKVLNRIFFLLQFIYYAFYFLPLKVRTMVLYIYCYFAGYPEYFLGTVIKASTPTVLDKVWFMADDEMDKVREIDEDTISRNLHRIKFYYGTTDGWVPKKYFHNLTQKFPGIDAELCTQKIDHGFVVSHGPTMGRMVSEWIIRRMGLKSS